MNIKSNIIVPESFVEEIGAYLDDHIPVVEFVNDNPAPDGWRLDGRVIDTFHMVHLREGVVNYTIAGETVRMRAGDCLMVAPDVVHSLEAEWDVWPVIQTCRFNFMQRKIISMAPVSFKYALFPCDSFHISAIWTSFYNLRNLGPVRSKRAMNCTLIYLLSELLLQATKEQHSDPVDDIIRNIRQFPGQRFSLDELASRSGLCRTALNLKVQEKTGMSTVQFAIHVRCEYASFQLMETTKTVKRIALELGYSSSYAFTNQFKKVTGYSPSEYRQLNCKPV